VNRLSSGSVRFRSVHRLLRLFVAVFGIFLGTTVVAAAATLPDPGSSSGFAHVPVLEIRVGVAATTVGLSVGLQPTIAAGQVGEKCPRFDGITSPSCVATKTIGPEYGPLKPTSSAPEIAAQKQAGHVQGTPQYANRIKQGTPTSAFSTAENAESLTQYAWKHGTPVPGRPGVRDFDFGRPIGCSPTGSPRSTVRVHVDSSGRIHGHPKG